MRRRRWVLSKAEVNALRLSRGEPAQAAATACARGGSRGSKAHMLCVSQQGRTNRRTHGGTAARAAGGRRRSWNCASVCGLRRSWTAVGGAARAESGQGVLGQGAQRVTKGSVTLLLQNWIPKIDDERGPQTRSKRANETRGTLRLVPPTRVPQAPYNWGRSAPVRRSNASRTPALGPAP